MLKTLERFREVNNTFPDNEILRGAKSQGKKVIGWLCTYLPEELLHAGGCLPIRITGYQQERELTTGDAYLRINTCSFSRSCLQILFDYGNNFIDGLVGGSTCDGARRLFDQWSMYLKDSSFGHFITIPRKYTERSHQLYYKQIVNFKEHLEEYLGKQITDEDLVKSIHLYNESRELLRKIYQLRKSDNPAIAGSELVELSLAGFRMPKELFNEYARNLLAELETSNRKLSGRVRLMLVGSILTNSQFVRSIEEVDALVVADELCSTTRYWSDPVVLDGTPPLQALAKRYLNNFPCARMVPLDERFDRIIQYIKEFKVDGVISQTIRYCVPYAHDLPLLIERLKEINVPVLSLDVEYGSSGSGQIRTRVQAFAEMLEGKKK